MTVQGPIGKLMKQQMVEIGTFTSVITAQASVYARSRSCLTRPEAMLMVAFPGPDWPELLKLVPLKIMTAS